MTPNLKALVERHTPKVIASNFYANINGIELDKLLTIIQKQAEALEMCQPEVCPSVCNYCRAINEIEKLCGKP